MDQVRPSSDCQNCGAPMTGRYCAACGQKDEHRILPLKHLLHEVFHDILHLDARFLGTLGMLFKPGALTREYLEGRRIRWFPPFRLYLIASLLFFTAASIGPATKDFKLTISPRGQVVLPDGRRIQEPSSAATTRLEQKVEAINRDPSAFLARLMAWLPRVIFLLLPFFALLLKLAYLRTRTLYAVHAIFSLHEHALAFLLFTGIKLLGYVPYLRSVRGLLFFVLPIHLVLSLKAVYRQGWTITVLKAAGIGLFHMLATLAVLVSTALALLLLP